MPLAALCFALLLSACAGAPAVASSAPPPADTLRAHLARLAGAVSGVVGVAAIHVETGERVSLNGRERFPMASVYKLPIALTVLHRVDRGELRLDSLVAIAPADFAPHHSPLAEGARGAPVRLSVARLLELMLGGSDNTASDALLRLVGGAREVTARLRDLGIEGVRVDRSEKELGLDQSGIEPAAGEPWSREWFHRRVAERSPERARAARSRFLADPRDTATPEGMAELLVAVQRGGGLSPASHQRLLRIMTETPTGANRIRGLLPTGTPVAHKTGSFGEGIAANDVGIVTLPEGRGHLAVAVFVKDSEADAPARERVIARVARALYDHFAARPAARSGQHARAFETTLTRRLTARYLLHLPSDYGRDHQRRWPLILYLHGGSLRGTAVDTVRVWGLPRRVERDSSFPFIVVSPQTDRGTLWTDTDLLVALLDEVAARYAVDTTRVYLTGHSMGGHGAWYLAYMHPERFAAVAPMSGPANPWWAGRLRDLPIWAFHGAQDSVVPLRESEEMVRALREAGNTRVRLTVLPERGHGLLDLYEEPGGELYRWFLEHRR